MSLSHQKPDLEESINVTEAHARVIREAAAAAREKHLVAADRQPISTWVLLPCLVAGIVAGGVIGKGDHFFQYGGTFRENYVRTTPPGADDSGPLPKPALDAYMAKGAKIYSAKCNGCHGADAKGDGSNYPSLVGSKWVLGETEGLAMIVLNGLQGPTSTGRTYGAGVMPAQGAGMSAEDLAGLMTYVRNSFGNSSGDVVTKEMAAAAFDISGARSNPGSPSTAAEITGEHAKALPGDPLDPAAMVNPLTLAPAAAE